ncbi:MAG: hypothetical protein KatS3mg076_2958 [Candidatus Binatia bacterium]|nr:MAG: hypothetical protein KatS3mg076_2958 [Candidatus Binatia bacterium]
MNAHYPVQQGATAPCTDVLVQACNCGMLHVHLGFVTLRLPPEGCRNLVRALGAALQALEGKRNEEIH